MRNILLSLGVLALLTGCSSGNQAPGGGAAVTFPPASPEADNQLAAASVIDGEITSEYSSDEPARLGGTPILNLTSPACASVREFYFPAEAPTGVAVGPEYGSSPDTPFAQHFHTAVELYPTDADAAQVIKAFAQPQAALCLRRIFEPELNAATGGTLSQVSTSVTPLEGFTSQSTAGIRIIGSAFLNRQATAPTLDVVAHRADRAVIYGFFFKTDGQTPIAVEREVIEKATAKAAATAKSAPSPSTNMPG